MQTCLTRMENRCDSDLVHRHNYNDQQYIYITDI